MRLFLLTALTMLAFAGNSLLNRVAVGTNGMDPASFALIRVIAGAAVLATILGARHLRHRVDLPAIGKSTVASVCGLALYLAGFSLAYQAMGAGAGALILFGSVQMTMFAGAMMQGLWPSRHQLSGVAIAFGGLLLLLWPGGTPIGLWPALAMTMAGVGWGVYSLAGTGAADPLGRTAVNFVLAAPVMVLFWWGTGMAALAGPGLWFAVLSGTVTSGLGYALWYAILPALGAQRAAVAQLTVPVIAAAIGAVWLAEDLGLRFVAACVLVLAGVALAGRAHRPKG